MQGRRGGAAAKIPPDATRWRSGLLTTNTELSNTSDMPSSPSRTLSRGGMHVAVTFPACLRVHRPSSTAVFRSVDALTKHPISL